MMGWCGVVEEKEPPRAKAHPSQGGEFNKGLSYEPAFFTAHIAGFNL